MKNIFKFSYGIVALIFLGLGILTYSNSLHNPFMMDDHAFFTLEKMRNLKFLKYQFIPDKNQVLGHEPLNKDTYYRPLAHVIPMLCYAVFGDDTTGYHIFNLILFWLACLMIYGFILTVFKNQWLGFITGLLYLVHPINGVMVNYITASVFSLQVIFMIAALWFILTSFTVIPAKAGIHNTAAMSFFILALMCHETAMALPFYLIPFLIFARRIPWKEALMKSLPFFIFLVLYFIFRLSHASLSESILDNYSQFHMSVPEYLASFSKLVFWYLSKLIYPSGIVLIWAMPVVRQYAAWWLLVGICLAAGFVYLLWRFKNKPQVALGLSWLIIGFLPATCACLFQPALGPLMEPHWFVFPVIGFFLLLSSIIVSLRGALLSTAIATKQSLFLMIILLIPWVITSRIYNTIWSNEKIYCYYWLKQDPNAAVMFYLAQSYSFDKEYGEARYYFLQALEHNYTPWMVFVNLGSMDMAEGKLDRAKKEFAQAYQGYPDSPVILTNMGIAAFKEGKYTEAQEILLKSLSIDPFLMETRLHLAITLEKLGKKDEAQKVYEGILQLSPHYEPALIWMTKMYYDRHDGEHVIQIARELYTYSKDPLTLKNVGILFQMYGLSQESARAFEKAAQQ